MTTDGGSFVANLIKSARAQMKALDQCLELLEGRLESDDVEQGSIIEQESGPSDVLTCPSCHVAFTESNEIKTMGLSKPYYVCHKCDFQGNL